MKIVKFVFGFALLIILGLLLFYVFTKSEEAPAPISTKLDEGGNAPGIYDDFPISIEAQRRKSYPGSEIQILETIGNFGSHTQYIASYKSDGLTIRGLLSIPTTPKPTGGYPAIIFNHGYIPHDVYRTTERYVAYFAGFASEGYVVFKPDYRGHGDSDGEATGAYFSPGYLTDVLNAFESIKKHPDVNPDKIGMWGHSLGGFLTLRSMVINQSIKAGVIWGGVVGSYQEMFEDWWSKRRNPTPNAAGNTNTNRSMRAQFIEQYGQPSAESEFWNAISATTYLKDISGPLQLHHGTADETVPVTLSEKLESRMKNESLSVELYTYPGSDHDITQGFSLAMRRSIEFFDKYLK